MTCDESIGSSDAICQCSSEVNVAPTEPGEEDLCDESQWPDLDHNLVCSDCKVLVNRFSSHYLTCNGYCNTMGRTCEGAWEEHGDTCTVDRDMTCDESISSSDAICQCGAEVSAAPISNAPVPSWVDRIQAANASVDSAAPTGSLA